MRRTKARNPALVSLGAILAELALCYLVADVQALEWINRNLNLFSSLKKEKAKFHNFSRFRWKQKEKSGVVASC